MTEAMAAAIAATICKSYPNLCTDGLLNTQSSHSTHSSHSLPLSDHQLVIADFGGSSAADWEAVNDGVMGGKSEGGWKVVNDGVMGGKSQGIVINLLKFYNEN